MYKKSLAFAAAAAICIALAGCAAGPAQDGTGAGESPQLDGVQIALADSGVRVDGEPASTDASSAVYVGADIVYYEAGRDASYGEGDESDGHTPEQAGANTVVTITKPGRYLLSGKLSAGQLAVDLGEGAEEDETAVVELVLNGVDISCEVAPAVIFYNVYESGSPDSAGAVVTLAQGSSNTVNGSYVARIYKEGTTDKLHKYDGALYSKMTMEVGGEGALDIVAQNEGLDSEMHLTINGGDISITAQNDGINTNEDGVSITTVNGGSLWIDAGLGEEGDGIDTNGTLVINGGSVFAFANPSSGDSGVDADGDITINGGTLLATGSMSDAVASSSGQPVIQMTMSDNLKAGDLIELFDAEGKSVYSQTANKAGRCLVISSPELTEGSVYSLYVGGARQQYGSLGGDRRGMGGGNPHGGTTPPDGATRPDGATMPDGATRPDGATPPDVATPPDGAALPNGVTPPEGEAKDGFTPPEGVEGAASEPSVDFTLTGRVTQFSGVGAAAEDETQTA